MKNTILTFILFTMIGLNVSAHKKSILQVYQTSVKGDKLKLIEVQTNSSNENIIRLYPETKYQTVLGFGGAFTEASASLLNKVSKANRQKILDAYFTSAGANYSLTRTHMGSCDFSLGHYCYAPVADDKQLSHFSVEEDKADLIPMIKDALATSKSGFRILASPWTAPPWMKDNKDWRGGRLLPEYYDSWALYFSKYIDAYKAQGINIWAFTVENEPLGCGDNWESMHFEPETMTNFVQHHLGPKLEADGHKQLLLGYDQNRGEVLKQWADVMYKDAASSKYYGGMAIHWYASTYEVFAQSLQYVHKSNPNKILLQTEACIDGIVPAWNDDKWYWSKEAKDWGWDWAPAEEKYLHPKYVPVYRYAADIIGCLNNWVNGWIDWNMVLDKQGGPNWFKNWCGAPILVDPDKDEVYITPLYYVMAHFSKFIRPGAQIIKSAIDDKSLQVAAAINPDKSTVVVVLNQDAQPKKFTLVSGRQKYAIAIDANALQTILIK